MDSRPRLHIDSGIAAGRAGDATSEKGGREGRRHLAHAIGPHPSVCSSRAALGIRRPVSGHKGHKLRGHGYKGAHHVAVLVLQDVAVVHVPAAIGGKANGDLDDLVGIDADGVL